MNTAKKVNGMDTIAVMIISVVVEVSSIGNPQAGKNGIGKEIMSHKPTRNRRIFHFRLSL
ncbi:MAG TPA: hypothetical protein VE548_16030 [Nitrososphaeraceae archaeon]|nr:hypothetical protein [Nitrososphaeraceae archaeon]